MNFMYKYIEFNSETYLDTSFFCLKHAYIIKHM